jgi:hypothetical protein
MRGQAHDVRWILATNVGGEEIPPFGLVEITGVEHNEVNQSLLEVERPTQSSPPLIAINSWQPILKGGFGLVAVEGPVYVQYDTGDTPALGEEWGAVEDSFLATKGTSGLIVYGTTAIGEAKSTPIMLAAFPGTGGSQWYVGKVITAAIDAESSGTVEQTDCAWEGTGATFTAYNPHDIELPVDLHVRWTKYPGWSACGDPATDWIVEPWHWTECP